MVPTSQQPHIVAVGHPFLQLEDWRSLTGLRPGARHTLQRSLPPSSGTWRGTLVPIQASCRCIQGIGLTKWRENSYLDWKIDELCQFKRCTATVWLLCDAFFVISFKTARSRHSENVNEKLEFADVLNGAPAAWKKKNCCRTKAVVAPYGHPPKLPRNTPKARRNLARDEFGGFVIQA
jgi:hypothetical protein